MKYLYLCLFFVTFSYYAVAQNQKSDCRCPVSNYSGIKPETTFRLSNNTSIALCGNKETGIIKGKTLYSEFVLSVCGSDKIIKFWDAVTVCDVKPKKDTLLVETLVSLPVGKSMEDEETVWTIERIYLAKGKIKRDSVINPGLPKYDQSQIATVINSYHHTLNSNNDTTVDLADKLFISAISGSKTAKNYLLNFTKKFTTLGGVYLEEYDKIIRMLKLWDKGNAAHS